MQYAAFEWQFSMIQYNLLKEGNLQCLMKVTL